MITHATTDHVVPFTQTALAVLRKTFPYGAAHTAQDATDTDVTPNRLHPAFHGALDWHSSVHMQWSLVQLLSRHRRVLDEAGLSEAVIGLLDDRLTSEHCGAEADYLRERPSYERPYGWAWALQLAAAATAGGPGTAQWAEALAPLTDLLAERVPDWLRRQAYPVRHGVHSNTAFSLSLIIDAGTVLDRSDLVTACRQRALDWFGADTVAHGGTTTGADTRWEPSGTDFLSPALSEADLISRVLPPSEYVAWLDDFLPGLGSGRHRNLLTTPEVRDQTDGQFVHLRGLALSRAAQLRRLAASRPRDDPGRRVLEEAASEQFDAAVPAVTDGHFMATHWLVSFALLALNAVPGQ